MNRKFFSASFLTTLLFVLALGISSCKKDDDKPNNEVRFQNMVASGANERPTVVNSPGKGMVDATYNRETKMITYTITWSGTTGPVNAMHFHNAIPTANLPATAVSGNVVIPIPGTGSPASYTSPLTGTTRALTMDEETALLAGNWYVNMHTSQFPAGELRANLVR